MSPEEIIRLLALAPHPEGGWYRETWRAKAGEGERAAGTAIYFLLESHQCSHWHRIDSAEVWHFYAGAPMRLNIAPTRDGPINSNILGADLANGQQPQRTVPPGYWQSAEPLGGWSLVGTTVSPGFLFNNFEMAPPDRKPTK